MARGSPWPRDTGDNKAGRQVAYWAQADLLSLLCQRGVLPSPDLDKVVAVACALRASEALAGQMSLQGRSTVSGA